MRESALTLLPQPDSPTRPSASPSPSVKDTPLTALTTPSWVKNCVRRSVTSSSGRFIEVSSVTALVASPLGMKLRGSVLDLYPSQDGFAGRRHLVQSTDHLLG